MGESLREHRVPEEVLDAVPRASTHGAQRVANELRLQAVQASPSGVRGVWLRHGLETRMQRLLRLEKTVQDDAFEEQIELLERHSPDLLLGDLEERRQGLRPGSHRRLLLAGLRQALQVEDAGDGGGSPLRPVLHCYDALGVKVEAVLTDNGREFCGRLDTPTYELMLAIEDIEHRKTRGARPVPTASSNGGTGRSSMSASGSPAAPPAMDYRPASFRFAFSPSSN